MFRLFSGQIWKIYLSLVTFWTACSSRNIAESNIRPNVVVLIADDLGIGDLGCYGNGTINTPNIDKLASEGVRLTHHLAAATMCTPSRAALVTARYAARYGLVGEDGTVSVIFHVASRVGLPTTEITIGRALEAANYTTAAVGKWHLGMECDLFGLNCDGPRQHGFQHFYGIPFTLFADLRGDHPFWIFDLENPRYQALIATWLASLLILWFFKVKFKWRLKMTFAAMIIATTFFFLAWFFFTHYQFHTASWMRVSPWMDKFMNGVFMHNDQVLEQPMILDGLTQNLLNFSLEFIANNANKDRPFFLYHSFGHPHIPMFTHPSFAGRSKHGRYGDNVEEMDAAVGAIMAAIQDHGLDESTIVYFLSDHGGHLEAIDESGQRVGGHNGLFKGGKGQGGSEGGIRVPGIYRWKDHLPSLVSIDTPTSLMDMMPTILELAGLPPLREIFPDLPPRELDGISIASLLLNQSQQPEPRVYIHHCMKAIHAIRWATDGHIYKMFLKQHRYPEGSHQCGWSVEEVCPCYGNSITDLTHQPLLFDLANDPYEDHPIHADSEEYKVVVTYLQHYLEEWRKRVPYPPSQFNSKMDIIHSLWLQPFCFQCTRG